MGKRLEGFGPVCRHLGKRCFSAASWFPPPQRGLVQQDTVPLLPGVCSAVLNNSSVFFFNITNTELWKSVCYKRQHIDLMSSCGAVSAAAHWSTWCSWMGLGICPEETHLEIVSRVRARRCPQPSLLSYYSTFPRAAIHSGLIFLLTGIWKGHEGRERYSQATLALTHRITSCTYILKCHNKATALVMNGDRQQEQPLPALFLDSAKIIQPYFCLWSLLTNPINLLCLAGTATALTTSQRCC